jgi:hypothetical protein
MSVGGRSRVYNKLGAAAVMERKISEAIIRKTLMAR